MHTSAAPVMSIQIFQIFLEECDEVSVTKKCILYFMYELIKG